VKTSFERFNFLNYPELTFTQPDRDTFRNLDLAFQALDIGGSAPCILNASNEIAVQAFINGKIDLVRIADVNNEVLSKIDVIQNPSLKELLEIDQTARHKAVTLVN
jgi:1-deoxy-D-xylulose-5-phosphate reductoisomerase